MKILSSIHHSFQESWISVDSTFYFGDHDFEMTLDSESNIFLSDSLVLVNDSLVEISPCWSVHLDHKKVDFSHYFYENFDNQVAGIDFDCETNLI